MKSGRRKDWESLLNPIDEKNLPWEDKQVLEEWIKEWEEFDKDAYRMSQERYAKHQIELTKIVKYLVKNTEQYDRIQKRMKEMESPITIHKYEDKN